MDNLYTIKLDTNIGEIRLEKIVEFTFGKRYFYYCTKEDVGRIDRDKIYKAFRLLNGSKWVPISMKKFK